MSDRGTYGQTPSRLSAWIGGGLVVGVGMWLWKHHGRQVRNLVSGAKQQKWLTPAQQDAYWDAYNVKRGAFAREQRK
jgi:hypothetical protein